MRGTWKEIKQIGHIEKEHMYSLVEASRVCSASAEMLRDYVKKGLVRKYQNGKGSHILIKGEDLIRFIADNEEKVRSDEERSREMRRERERAWRMKKKEEKKAEHPQQKALFKEQAVLSSHALLAEIRALRAEVAALKKR